MAFFDENSEVRLTLAAINRLVRRMPEESPDERLATYAQIRALARDLEAYNNRDDSRHPTGNVRIYLGELLWPCRTLAGLSDGNGHSESMHMTWALTALKKLASEHAFDVGRT